MSKELLKYRFYLLHWTQKRGWSKRRDNLLLGPWCKITRIWRQLCILKPSEGSRRLENRGPFCPLPYHPAEAPEWAPFLLGLQTLGSVFIRGNTARFVLIILFPKCMTWNSIQICRLLIEILLGIRNALQIEGSFALLNQKACP